MRSSTTNATAVHAQAEESGALFDNWFDPIEAGLRARVRGFIETMLEEELEAALGRPRYGRQAGERSNESAGVCGHRHGRRTRTLTGKMEGLSSSVERISRTRWANENDAFSRKI